ncbi:RNA polymerase II subunit A C-terminal domain phosphatase-like [Glandiceps talaboti]
MATPLKTVSLPGTNSCRITKWKVKPGSPINQGTILALYKPMNPENGDNKPEEKLKLKSNEAGTVSELVVREGQVATPGSCLLRFEGCTHPTVMKDMCAECGADLRAIEGQPGERIEATSASVSMIHNIPELQVSHEEAVKLAKADEQRLLKNRKLVCIVDLDQTIIHTTMDNVPQNMKDVHHFQLWAGPQYPWFHTRLRPKCKEFLEKIAKLYELHIFTFGARLYAHTIAECIDPERKLFSYRIVSRDECFDSNSKTANLKSIFPCGDNMVCIIDDREDVWNYAPNMIHVKPYHYFEGTGDINSPPGLPKKYGEQTDTDNDISDNNNVKTSVTAMESSDQSTDTNNGSKGGDESEAVSADKTSVEDNNESKNTQSQGKDMDSKNGDTGKGERDHDDDRKGKDETVTDVAKPNSETVTDNSSDPKNSAQTHKNGVTANKDKKENSGKETEKEEEKLIEYKDDDDYLYYLEDILARIHQKFYKMYDHIKAKQKDSDQVDLPDLKVIVDTMKKKVLRGTNILFSGVFPTNMPPEKSRAWKVAQALGANVQTTFVARSKDKKNIANATTHVVAAKAGTAKVTQAHLSKGAHIITPDWLWCCHERLERVDERLFKLHISKSTSSSSSRSASPAIRTSDATTEKPLPPEPPSLPVYDPVTGKRIRKDANLPSIPGSHTKGKHQGSQAKRTQEDNSQDKDMFQRMYARQPSISETVNPLYSFSTEELEDMDKEVEDIFGDSDSEKERESDSTPSSSSETLGSTTKLPSSSSDDSLTGENPRGWKKRKRRPTDDDEEEGLRDMKVRREQRDSSSSAGLSEEDLSSDEDKMAAAIDDLLTYSKKL